MTSLLMIIFAVVVIHLFFTTLAARKRVQAGGIAQTEEFLNAGVSLTTLNEGSVPEPDSGSMVTTREGVRVVRVGDGIQVIPTRTISRDLA